MLSGSLVSAFLIYGVGVCPKVEGVTWRRYLTLIVPLAAVYAYQLWSSNAAYLYLAVGYIQVARRGMGRAGGSHTESGPGCLLVVRSMQVTSFFAD
jgi:hypothetical protein